MKYSPEDLDNYKQIAICFYRLKEYDNSLKYFKLYEKYRPADYSVSHYIAGIYDILNQKENAISYYEKAIKISNDYKLYGNLARLYADVYIFGEKEKQIYYADKAYELNPEDPINILNKLLLYCRFNMVEEAKEYWQKILPLKPSAPVLFSYGCFLIHNKEFADGFKLYRYRIEHDQDALPSGLKNLWQPNIDLKDKTILISYEQGFGDTLMFIRFVKDMTPLCKKIKVLVQDELYDLLKPNFDFEIYSDYERGNIEYDYFIPMMDIPLFINLTPEKITQKDGYISTNKKFDIPKSNKFKIGICYQGSKDSIKTCRDIPLKELKPIFDLDVQVYSFQKDSWEDESLYPTIRLGDKFKNFEDTAAAMQQMDLMITTDNGVLNLAGALGVKTFAIFNKYPEFRWFNLNEDIGWYNIKPFQCSEFNNWQEPVNNIVKELKRILE